MLLYTLRQSLEKYTGKGLNGYSYLIADTHQSAFTIVAVGYVNGERFANADLIVRI
jgi:hypothetical protein